MAKVELNQYGVVATFSSSETYTLLAEALKGGAAVVTVLGPFLIAAHVAAPWIAAIEAAIGGYFAVQYELIKLAKSSYGVYLTMPWPAVISGNWWLIIPTGVPPPGVGACPAGGRHFFASSSDYHVVIDDPSAPGQDEWRYCEKCSALNWSGNGTVDDGVCPTGGKHKRGTSNYTLVMNVPAAPGQHGWRWCDKCNGLIWGFQEGEEGVCPAGGKHRRGTTDYAVAMDNPAAPGQHGWRWCEKCSGLIWAG